MHKSYMTLVAEIITIIMFVVSLLTLPQFLKSIIDSGKSIGPWALAGGAVLGLAFLFLAVNWTVNTTDHLRSGIEKYIPRYTLAENRKTWDTCESNFKYIGVTGKTFKVPFLHWLNGQGTADQRTYEFLFLKPRSAVMREQVLHSKSYSANDIPPKELQAIEDEIATQAANVKTTVAELKTTKAYQEGRLKIRYYDEYLNWWVQIIDNQRIYLGLLRKGSSGFEGANLVLRRAGPRLFAKQESTLYATFMDMWERLWQNGEDACN